MITEGASWPDYIVRSFREVAVVVARYRGESGKGKIPYKAIVGDLYIFNGIELMHHR
jgi:hypothetical protein